MAPIRDAREAETMICSLFPNPIGPHPYNFGIRKQGFTWIVTYDIQTTFSIEGHEVHINAITGNMLRIS